MALVKVYDFSKTGCKIVSFWNVGSAYAYMLGYADSKRFQVRILVLKG